MTVFGMSNFFFSRAFTPLVYTSINDYFDLDGKQHHASLCSLARVENQISFFSSELMGVKTEVNGEQNV